MKFSVLSLIGHAPHPLTGELPPAADRIPGAVAERLGFGGRRRRGGRVPAGAEGCDDGFGLSHPQQIETLQRFAEEIAPVVRREAPSMLWN
ncbi:hypothetical protein [Streptomyces sp. NPDC057582]|uniref:hypothetical protein n=1 Tax=Streptomyces sp. NPDC057582 TaxID=3346174 RepID=UPI00369E5C30